MATDRDEERLFLEIERTEEGEKRAIRAGVHWLSEQIDEGEGEIGFIGVDAKKYIKDSVASGLGGLAKPLREDNQVTYEGNELYLFSEEKNYSKSYKQGPALVVLPTDRLLDDMESDPQVTDILVLSWRTGAYDDCEEWRQEYSPTEVSLVQKDE